MGLELEWEKNLPTGAGFRNHPQYVPWSIHGLWIIYIYIWSHHHEGFRTYNGYIITPINGAPTIPFDGKIQQLLTIAHISTIPNFQTIQAEHESLILDKFGLFLITLTQILSYRTILQMGSRMINIIQLDGDIRDINGYMTYGDNLSK